MDDRQINRLLRRALRGPAWFLLAYFLLMNVMVILGAVVERAGLSFQAMASGNLPFQPDPDAILGYGWGYIAAVAVGLLILFAGRGADFWCCRVLQKKEAMTGSALTAFLVIGMGIQFLNGIWISLLEWVLNLFGGTVLGTLEAVSGASDTFSMFLYASIVGPVAEELIFRGYIQRSLERYGRRFSILGSAFLFGLFHGNLLQIPYAFAMGLVFGYVTSRYHIGWAIALHLFNNLVLADLLTRITSHLPEDWISAINLLLLGGAALISLVLLVFKHRQIRKYYKEERLDSRCLLCFFTNSGVLAMILVMAVNAAMALTM